VLADRRPDRPEPRDGGAAASPPAPSRARTAYVAGVALSILGALAVVFVAGVTVVGRLSYAHDQRSGYARLRADLANATAPVGPAAIGRPVAIVELPGVRAVVREGTTSSVLASGPGHRRDTPLPGQPGTSVLMGRAAAYGGPFGSLARLKQGDTVTVTTGQGRQVFRVRGPRRAGDPQPPPLAPGAARLTLVTADGGAYAPSGVLRVDADLVGTAQPAAARPAVALAPAEQAMRGDRTALVPLVLLAQLLLAAALAFTWLRGRWGRRQAWVAGVPVLAVLSLAVATQAARLLPNLL
jgi:hypothetical protein